MALDNLLGACTPESDLTRRWEIMVPEAEVTVFAFVPAGVAPLVLSDGLLGGSIR